jgi:hypothetical protein
MRRERDAGEVLRVLSERYGMSIASVHKICTRATWSHVV